MNTGRRWLLADIGGSRTRIGILDDRDDIRAIQVLSNDTLPDLISALRSYLEEEGTQPSIRAGALAVAAPIVGDRVRMVNRGWSFSIQAIKEALGWERIEVINDFTAIAYALPRLDASHRHQIGAGEPQANAPLGVIGPGTGLEVSGLIPYRSGWVPLASEGGHVTLAPMNDAEAAVLGRLRARTCPRSAPYPDPGWWRSIKVWWRSPVMWSRIEPRPRSRPEPYSERTVMLPMPWTCSSAFSAPWREILP